MANAAGYALFPTALGAVGIAWSERGVAGVFLPDASEAALCRRIARRFPAARPLAPPADVQPAIDAIRATLRGERVDSSAIALDLQAIPELHRRIYATCRTIPAGKTLAYGELAGRLGDERLAREVGAAMARNPIPILVPCHRVLGANGKLGGFSAPGGTATKLRLLSIEGVQLPGTLPLFAACGGDANGA
jgi:methylated-DNA-[protein]-cysteine S-methyltransferase